MEREVSSLGLARDIRAIRVIWAIRVIRVIGFLGPPITLTHTHTPDERAERRACKILTHTHPRRTNYEINLQHPTNNPNPHTLGETTQVGRVP